MNWKKNLILFFKFNLIITFKNMLNEFFFGGGVLGKKKNLLFKIWYVKL